MLKLTGNLLILASVGWMLYMAGVDILEARRGQVPWEDLIGKLALRGLAPMLLGVSVGAGLIFLQSRSVHAQTVFDHEQMMLQLLQKEPHLQFRKIMLDVPLSKPDLIELLVGMGRKKLFQGGIDPRFGRVVLLEAMERKIEPGECPFCDGLTSGLSPEESVCTQCEAHLFHPAE